jgi:hypothetical protein
VFTLEARVRPISARRGGPTEAPPPRVYSHITTVEQVSSPIPENRVASDPQRDSRPVVHCIGLAMSHRRPLVVRLPFVLAITLTVPAPILAQQAPQLTGVRLENAFRLLGSNSSGLVVSVKLDERQSRRTSDDLALVLFDSSGRRLGTMACLALRFLDGVDSKPAWTLLDDASGTLARQYRALIDSHVAVIAHARKASLQDAGRYEFVYVVGSNQKQAALAYGEDVVHRPVDLEQRLIGSFKVPW